MWRRRDVSGGKGRKAGFLTGARSPCPCTKRSLTSLCRGRLLVGNRPFPLPIETGPQLRLERGHAGKVVRCRKRTKQEQNEEKERKSGKKRGEPPPAPRATCCDAAPFQPCAGIDTVPLRVRISTCRISAELSNECRPRGRCCMALTIVGVSLGTPGDKRLFFSSPLSVHVEPHVSLSFSPSSLYPSTLPPPPLSPNTPAFLRR